MSKNRHLNILIVEDCIDDLESYTRILSKIFDCTIDHFAMGEDALNIFDTKDYDLLFLDYHLPDMTGVTFLQKLTLLQKNIMCPVIVLTGQGSENVAVQFLKMGASDYLEKKRVSFESLSRASLNALEKFHEKKIAYEKQEELSFFAHTLAHDLRAPLGRLAAYGRLMKKKAPEYLNKYIDNIEEDAEYMSLFLDRLLQYAEYGRSTSQKEQVDLNEVVQQSLQNLEIEITKKKATVHFETLPFLYGDKLSLIQLFQNLVGNALKYSIHTPHIAISSKDMGDNFYIEISDNGVGIPKDKLSDIFKPFTRIQETSENEGIGLGLALCKKIADQHGAMIHAIPKKEGGTTFKLSFG